MARDATVQELKDLLEKVIAFYITQTNASTHILTHALSLIVPSESETCWRSFFEVTQQSQEFLQTFLGAGKTDSIN